MLCEQFQKIIFIHMPIICKCTGQDLCLELYTVKGNWLLFFCGYEKRLTPWYQADSQSRLRFKTTVSCAFNMQAARHAAKQLAQRYATQFKSVRGMASDASSEKAHFDEAMKEMSKWCAGILQSSVDACEPHDSCRHEHTSDLTAC